jgi:hypothetical protein
MDGLTRFLAPLLPAPCELDIEAYTVHLETQMHHGKLRKLLFNSYVYLAALARSLVWPGLVWPGR